MDAGIGTAWMTASAGPLAGSGPVGRAGLPSGGLGGEGFGSILKRSTAAGQSPEQRAREGAQELIAVALVQPVLKSLRSSNQASAPFAPGDYEKTFGAMADAQMASNLVKSGRWGLVDAVARNLLRSHPEGADQAKAGGLGDGGDKAGKPVQAAGGGGS